jgi:metal-responsive CopG/Arc/MetJ family transcriptional regulator
MKNVAKVAVSLPDATFRSLERARARLHKTRSAAVAEAIQCWLSTEEISREDRSYVEGYLRQPEQTKELGAIAVAAVEAWEPWK